VGYNGHMFTVITTEVFDTWLAKLRDRQARVRVLSRLTRIGLGNLGDTKSVGARVSELRIDYGPGYRRYYTRRGTDVVMLLIGGDKSTQAKDIKKAIEMAAQLKE